MINSAILEQTFLVEFVVFNQMCTDCQRKETNDFWKAVVQVRQKVIVSNMMTDRQTDKLADVTKSILYVHCSMTNGIFFLGVPQENIFLSGAVNTEEHSSL